MSLPRNNHPLFGELPFCRCRQNGLAAASTTTVAAEAPEKGIAGTCESRRRGIAHYAAQRGLKLELIDLILHISHAIAAKCIEHLLDARRGIGIDSGSIHCAVVIYAIYRALCSAATVSDLALDLIGLPECAVAETANGIICLPGNGCLIVAEPADGIFEIIKIHCIAQSGFRYRLTASAISKEAIAAPKHGEDQQGENPEKASAAKAEAVIAISYGGDIREGYI